METNRKKKKRKKKRRQWKRYQVSSSVQGSCGHTRAILKLLPGSWRPRSELFWWSTFSSISRQSTMRIALICLIEQNKERKAKGMSGREQREPPPARKRRSEGQPPWEGRAPLPPWGDGTRRLSAAVWGFWCWKRHRMVASKAVVEVELESSCGSSASFSPSLFVSLQFVTHSHTPYI